MRLFTFLSTLALLCALVTSAAISPAIDGSDKATIEETVLEPQPPKLERPPPGHMVRKRAAGEMFTFGGYKTSISGDASYLKLEEPIEANGHPHPWCQGFPGSNGYTEGQEPTIHTAHMDKAKNESDVPGVPQFICWFYNDFDCDPSKGATGSAKFNITHTYLTDLSKKVNNSDESTGNRDLPMQNTDSAGKRYMWIKAYGCLRYVDNPSDDSNTAQGASAEISLSAAELNAGVVLRDLAKRAASWLGL